MNQTSYDKGFWSPANLAELETFLERPVLPKKGRLSATDKARENHLEFRRARRQHSAVESDIHCLEIWWTPLSRQKTNKFKLSPGSGREPLMQSELPEVFCS